MKATGRQRKGRSEIMSVRLDGRRRRAIARLAAARNVTPSEVVRTAVDALLDRSTAAQRPFDGWKSVIGLLDDAAPDLSERTGTRFTELLRRRRRT